MKSEAQYDATRKYALKNYDHKIVRFPKGALEQITELARAEGISVNRYILEAVEQRSGLQLTLNNGLPWIKK